MKKIYQTYHWIIFLSFTLICSCTNDVDDRIHLVKEIVEISIDGSSKSTVINYDGNKISSIDNSIKRTDFFYTGSLITKIEEMDKVKKQIITLQYTYSNDLLVKITSSDNYSINYIHNADGSVSYEKLSKDSSNKDIKIFHGVLYFKSTNLVKDDMIIDNAGAKIISKKVVNLEYDYKNNAFHNILGFKKLLNYYKSISLNNSVVSTEVSEIKDVDTDQVTSSLQMFKSEYKYNSGGYPEEIISEKSVLENVKISTLYKSILYYN